MGNELICGASVAVVYQSVHETGCVPRTVWCAVNTWLSSEIYRMKASSGTDRPSFVKYNGTFFGKACQKWLEVVYIDGADRVGRHGDTCVVK